MWRSLLFVPALNDRMVARAPTCGADALVLDLEAAVPPDRKEEARTRLATLVPKLQAAGASVAVRINLLNRGGIADIAAVLTSGAETIVLPCATPVTVEQAAREAGPNMRLIPLIENPRGVIQALNTADASSSVVALGFGVEDYSAEMGAPPTPDLLTYPAFQIIQAARAADIEPLVFPDTIADYQDLPRFQTAAQFAKSMGASGGFAIHPGQVDVLNRIHTPNAAEQEAASAVLDAAKTARAEGRSIATLNGQMIDGPVEERARKVLARAIQSSG